jgi:hypothetical protein
MSGAHCCLLLQTPLSGEPLADGAKPRRAAGGAIPLLWGQSLLVVADLLREQLLHPSAIDPLGRRLAVCSVRQLQMMTMVPMGNMPTTLRPDLVVQVHLASGPLQRTVHIRF